MPKSDVEMTAGEVCTLNRIKQLGIETNQDIFDPNVYVKPDSRYQDLRTFNRDKDGKEGRIKTLCKEGLDGAYPHCIDEHGPGFVRKPGDPGKCITYDCPPGFTKESGLCNKEPMLRDARIDKRARCDERWYDWFTIPNYHLGNKYYAEKVGTCYAPCPAEHVPNYGTDPVDNMRLGFTAKDEMGKCVHRGDYFLGKYGKGTDYCPLAWIARINATQENVRRTIEQKRSAVAKSYENRTTNEFNNAAANVTGEALFVHQTCSSLLTNIDKPDEATSTACKQLQTPERLREAYRACKQLEEEETTIRYDRDDARDLKKKAMMKQACNAVFCNEENYEATEFINEEPLCFKDPPKIDPETGLPDNNEPQDVPAPTYEPERSFINTSIRMLILFILLPVMLVIIYLFISRFIWPRILRPLLDMAGLISPAYKYEEAALKENRRIFKAVAPK